MPTPIRIQVVRDEDGSTVAETEAEVVVGRRDLIGDSSYPYDDLIATFTHDSDGHYVNATGDPENEPGPGEWLLVVRKDDFSLVVQKLTIDEKSGILRARGGWKEKNAETGVAATVSIVNFDQARGKPQATQSVIVVKLFPIQRYVGCGCRDHHGGTRFTLFAEGRRDHLFDLGKLNAGAISTILDCRVNEVVTTVKGSRRAPNQWVVVSREPSAEKLGILDFYRILDQIGTDQPGSVLEAGVYGHAWHQGPIVQGTFDQSDDLTVRDTADLDARPKDWYPEGPVANDFPKAKDAFASDARLVAWGCSHMVNVISEAEEANERVAQGTPRDKFFTVTWTDGGRLHTTLDYTKRSIAEYVQSDRRGRYPEHGSASAQCTYGGMMAQAVGDSIRCFLATPGMGANFGSVKGPRAKDGKQFTHITMHVVDDGENARVKKYFQREYGDSYERDEQHYMNYTKFLGASVPDPGWSTERFAVYFWDELAPGAHILRLPSHLEVVRKKGPAGFDAPVPFSRDGETGHLYVVKAAVAGSVQVRGPATLFVVKARDDLDLGIFVTQTGKTLFFERPKGAKDFGLPATLPNKFVMRMLFDPVYDRLPGDTGTPLTSNLIEEVTPQWFW